MLISLARALDVSEEYLLGEQDLALDGVEFRKKADMSAQEAAQGPIRSLAGPQTRETNNSSKLPCDHGAIVVKDAPRCLRLVELVDDRNHPGNALRRCDGRVIRPVVGAKFGMHRGVSDTR